MTIDVSDLIDKEHITHRGTQCATCAWLRGRPDEERVAWNAELSRSTDERQTAAIVRAMRAAAELTKGKEPPSDSSVGKHRREKHSA